MQPPMVVCYRRSVSMCLPLFSMIKIFQNRQQNKSDYFKDLYCIIFSYKRLMNGYLLVLFTADAQNKWCY